MITQWGWPSMITPSNGNIFRVTGHLCGEFTGHRWIPPQRSVSRSVNVFFDHRLNKRLSKQSWGSWFETTSRSVWRHCNAPLNVVMVCINGVNYAHKRLPNTNSSVYSKLCNGFLNQCIRKTRIDIYELTRYTNDIHKQGIHLKWLKI